MIYFLRWTVQTLSCMWNPGETIQSVGATIIVSLVKQTITLLAFSKSPALVGSLSQILLVRLKTQRCSAHGY